MTKKSKKHTVKIRATKKTRKSRANKTKSVRRRQLRRYWRIFISVAFLITILYAISFWSHHPSVNINEVSVIGNKYSSAEDIENIFYEETNGDHLFLANKRSSVFMPKQKIINRVEEILAVKKATLRTRNLNKVEIEIIEHQPWGIWCTDVCKFVSSEGVAFTDSPTTVFEDLIDLDFDISQTDSELFNKLADIRQNLLLLNIELSRITTDDYETFSLHTKAGPTLLIDTEDSSDGVVDNLQTTISQESINEVQFRNVDYFDLRFEGRVYYKIK